MRYKRVGLLAVALTCCTVAAWPQSIRFEPYSGELAYGLIVVPPWRDGGTLLINFPEHLEAGADGSVNILRYYDKEARGHWQVSPDGSSAVLDVESLKTPGVRVNATGTVVRQDAIHFTFEIINKTAKPLLMVNPLYCHRYGQLSGFAPRADPSKEDFPNFEYIYVLVKGQVVRVSDIPARNARSRVKGVNVAGCTQAESDFVERRGGRLEAPVDAAISAATSLDGRRKLILAWTPGKSFLSNAEIPCLHADPYYGTIEPGKSTKARGVLILTEGPLETEMLRLFRQGAEQAPRAVTDAGRPDASLMMGQEGHK